MTTNKKTYINSFDSVSCAGFGCEELFQAICEKKDSISLDNSYVKDKSVAIGKIGNLTPFETLLITKCKEVLKVSNLENFEDTLLVIGSSVGGMAKTEEIFFTQKSYKNIDPDFHTIDAICKILEKEFTFYDNISFSTACTSSANALGYAKEVISKGIYKNVLVVGIDSLSHTTVCGFNALSVLSSSPCKPFDKNRDGMNVSEAIAVLLLQDEIKDENSIELCGVGYSSDAHHMTQPHPEGKGACKAMENAIADAKISLKDIAYINAHGTGTFANDFSELTAIKSLFTEHKPYVSSTKSITGHTLGAAGALEAIISCMVLQKQIIIPNKNLEEIDIDGINYSFETLKGDFSYVLSNSFAFGGNNTSLVFGSLK